MQIQKLSLTNSFYGAKRIAVHFKLFGNSSGRKVLVNHKRISRVMDKYDLRCRFRRKKSNPKTKDNGLPNLETPNLLKVLQQESKIQSLPLFTFEGEPYELASCGDTTASSDNSSSSTTTGNTSNLEVGICRPNQVWGKDFTYVYYQDSFLYVATLKDCYTREIVGFSIAQNHDQQLVTVAFNQAIANYYIPEIVHSDQGSEYRARDYQKLIQDLGISISMSAKGKPWENGYQESYYSYFKLELGSTARFETKGELVEAIYKQIYDYNNYRIHTAIKTTPVLKRKEWELQNPNYNPNYNYNLNSLNSDLELV